MKYQQQPTAKSIEKNVTAFYDANTGNIYKQEISDNVNAAA